VQRSEIKAKAGIRMAKKPKTFAAKTSKKKDKLVKVYP
jgi:hypothetical protein